MPTKVVIAQMSGFRKLKEPNCWGLSFQTQETDRETAMELSDFNSELVKLVITDEGVDKEIIGLVEDVEINQNERWSASQKLRFAIQDLALAKGIDDKEGIESHYQEWINKFINHINNLK